MTFLSVRSAQASRRLPFGNTRRPSTTAASGAFSSRTNKRIWPWRFAFQRDGMHAFDRAHRPSNPSSPTMQQSLSTGSTLVPLAAIMAGVIGRSNEGPTFFKAVRATLMILMASPRTSAEAAMA